MSYKLMKKEDLDLYLKELTIVIRKNQRYIIVSIKKQLKYCFFIELNYTSWYDVLRKEKYIWTYNLIEVY